MSFDIIIIGAGLAGINSAFRIQSKLPTLSYSILEARGDVGGTWDLFRYPGIRSDSDLYSYGFAWYPWNRPTPIAGGASIKQYIRDAATEYGIHKHIRFNQKVVEASWSSSDKAWSLTIESNGISKCYICRWVIFGTGYYDYHQPLQADIHGLSNFKGPVLHPQFWPENFDYRGKSVVVIGSGATAVTLVPTLTEEASTVTMLQRSPTYIMSLSNSASGECIKGILPKGLVQKWMRLSWILQAQVFYRFCRRFPRAARWVLRRSAKQQLPKHIPIDPHFSPKYNPWDQRLCVCPDGDFYKSLHTGKVFIKTDTINHVDESSIHLDSGKILPADIIVTATGLKLQIAGGIDIKVDGVKCDISKKFAWQGVMLQDIPNAAFVIGFANESWTLGADVTALFVCRLLQHLQRQQCSAAVPKLSKEKGLKLHPRKLINWTSTYVAAAEGQLPMASDKRPWKGREDYLSDMIFSRISPLDTSLELS